MGIVMNSHDVCHRRAISFQCFDGFLFQRLGSFIIYDRHGFRKIGIYSLNTV